MDTLRKKNIVSQYMKHIMKLNTMEIQFTGKNLFIKQNIIMKLINGSMNVVLKHLEKIKILTGEIYVLSDPEDENSVIREITPEIYENLKKDGTVSGGMIPKLDNAFASLKLGVSKVVITNAAELGRGTGTEVHL